MTWRHRLAIWLRHLTADLDLLMPKGIDRTEPPPNICPDFLEPDELDADDWAQWAESCAKHPSTLAHLNRCLDR